MVRSCSGQLCLGTAFVPLRGSQRIRTPNCRPESFLPSVDHDSRRWCWHSALARSVSVPACLAKALAPSSSLDRTRVYRKLCSWRRFWSRTRGWSLYGNHRADWVRRRGCPLDLCNRSSLACSALPLLAGTPALDDPVLCPDLRGRNTQARSANRFGAGLQPSQQLPRDRLVILVSQCGSSRVLHQERRRPRVNDYSSAPSLRLIHNHAQRLVRFGTPLRPPIQTHQAPYRK